MKIIFTLLTTFLLLTYCSKKCDCPQLPFETSSWKITNIIGGIAGTNLMLNPDQQNSILTYTSQNTYSVKNTSTGNIKTGSISYFATNNIIIAKFNPSISIFGDNEFIFTHYDNYTHTYTNNFPDGYTITLTKQ